MKLITRKLVGIFDWILPKAWHARRDPNPDINDAVLARLSDSDPVYRLLMDHARVNFEKWTMAALEPGLKPDDRNYLCGQAMGTYQFMQSVEATRETLHLQLQKREAAELERAKERARRATWNAPPPPGAL